MLQLPQILEGCKVFPCRPRGKKPAFNEGFHAATNDPRQIAEWEHENPGYNWAVACGYSGLFVIDVDPEGFPHWKAILDGNPEIAALVDQAFKVRTPRGGLHVYFKGSGPTTAGRIAEGIDTRGGFMSGGKLISGGYVLLPGSETPAGPYEALGGSLVPLTPAIAGLVPERKQIKTTGLDKDPAKDNPRNIQWAVDILAAMREAGPVAIQGNRNDAAYRAAAQVLDKGLSPGMAYDLLQEHWNPYCAPPLEDWELEHCVRSAYAYGDETQSGAKGFQANAEAFAGFQGKDYTPPEAKSRRSHVMLWHEYADSVEDPSWLIPGMLPSTGTGILYGRTGSYKSFVTLDMALSLAYGVSGQWGSAPVKHDVLFLAGEGPRQTAKKRIPAWLEWQGIKNRVDHRLFLYDRVPFYTDQESWEQIKQDLEEWEARPSLIVIDTLSRLMTGLDESSTKDAVIIVNFLEELARYYEAFVLAIHHEGKDEKRGARGSSVLEANPDMAVAFKKRMGGTELRVIKQKDADVTDNRTFLAVKEMANSIVLEKTEALAEEPQQGSRTASWASPEEIVPRIVKAGGSIAHDMLCQMIASELNLDVRIVKSKLSRSKDLEGFRKGGQWLVALKYDL